jgi:Domain of unknown function (DUF5667)
MSGRERRGILDRPVMRESFRTELRSRLLTEAAVVLAPRPRRFVPSWSILRPALAVAALALVIAWGTTSAAAASLPGDPLYAVKRATEEVQLTLTFDDVARMQLLAEIADRRLDELARIAQQQPSNAPTATSEYADAVSKFTNAVDDLRDADSEDKRNAADAVADAAREKHIAVLDAIKDRVPESTRPEIDRLIDDERQGIAPSGHGDGGQRDRTTPKPGAQTPRATPRTTLRPAGTPRPSGHD